MLRLEVRLNTRWEYSDQAEKARERDSRTDDSLTSFGLQLARLHSRGRKILL